MAILIPNFNDRDLELISPSPDVDVGIGNLERKYVRVVVLDQNLNVPRTKEGKLSVFFSTLDSNYVSIQRIGPPRRTNKLIKNDTLVDFTIYRNPDGNIYIRPTEILNKASLPRGNYSLQIDVL